MFIQVIRTYTVKEIKAFSEASAVAQEVLGSIRTVTAFGGQKKEEKRFEGDKIRRNSFQTWFSFRFSENLVEAKRIALKKGLYMGLCQAAAQIAIYISFAMTFWCKNNWWVNLIMRLFSSRWTVSCSTSMWKL